MSLENDLRVVPNFPKEGIEFLDISPLLESASNLKQLIQELAKTCSEFEFTKIVAIESRGFILGSALALHMNKGFAMVRKKGKLPGKTVSNTYDLEYGTDTIEMLPTSINAGERILVLDDVLATGGTAAAACELVQELGGYVVASVFLIELDFLKGREKLNCPIRSVIHRK